jgi:hypothetical protein
MPLATSGHPVFQVCARAARAGFRRAAPQRVRRSGAAAWRARAWHAGSRRATSPFGRVRPCARPSVADALCARPAQFSTFVSLARRYSGAKRLNNPNAPGDASTRAPQPTTSCGVAAAKSRSPPAPSRVAFLPPCPPRRLL